MLDHAHTPPARPAHPAEVYAQHLFRRVLASWVLDCSRLHRKGLLRPCYRPAEGTGADERAAGHAAGHRRSMALGRRAG